jgi:hypothetical protein
MYGKAGKDTAGRQHSTQRQGTILRFLAASEEPEIHIFLDLVFEPFRDFMAGDVLEKVEGLSGEVNMKSVIPLGKQHR